MRTTYTSVSGALAGCPVATGVRTVWRAAPAAPGDRVAVLGCGGVDFAFEATRRPEPMRAAVLSTRERGRAVLIGIPSPTDAREAIGRGLELLESGDALRVVVEPDRAG